LSLKFTYKSFVLEYGIFGSGNETILCFHGFGRKWEDFELFTSLLKPNQRLVSINLFAHHGSVFPEERIDNQPLLLNEWDELLSAFLDELHVDRFHLLGYSMGGRICLVTMNLMPDRVKSVLLIATDGLKINAMYKFASGTVLGKYLYRKLIDNPKPLFWVADVLHKLKILHPKLHRFTHVHLDTREKRLLVHDAWLIYRNFFPDLHKTAAIIKGRPIPFHMIFGKYDSVIRPELGEKFCRILGDMKYMSVISSGHRLLNDQLLDYIRERDLWP
jgi:pimeloyl-ACP methyl ester carboxylesterase